MTEVNSKIKHNSKIEKKTFCQKNIYIYINCDKMQTFPDTKLPVLLKVLRRAFKTLKRNRSFRRTKADKN